MLRSDIKEALGDAPALLKVAEIFHLFQLRARNQTLVTCNEAPTPGQKLLLRGVHGLRSLTSGDEPEAFVRKILVSQPSIAFDRMLGALVEPGVRDHERQNIVLRHMKEMSERIQLGLRNMSHMAAPSDTPPPEESYLHGSGINMTLPDLMAVYKYDLLPALEEAIKDQEPGVPPTLRLTMNARVARDWYGETITPEQWQEAASDNALRVLHALGEPDYRPQSRLDLTG